MSSQNPTIPNRAFNCARGASPYICRKLRSYPRKTETRLERAAKIEPREVLGFALLKHNVNMYVFSKRELISNPGHFSVPCRVRPGNEIRHYRAITVKYWSKNARDKGKNPKKVIRISRFQVLILSVEFKRSKPAGNTCR